MTQRRVQLVLGGPGCGKTTHFIGNDTKQGVIGKLLEEGLEPANIAYVSFTRKAADEAAERAMVQFNLTRADLPYFRTLHSLAFQSLGLRNGEVMQRKDYKHVADALGMVFTGFNDPADGPVAPNRDGDLAIQWLNYAQARRLPLKQVWERSGEAVQWHLVKLLRDTLAQYKRDVGKLDFGDMLDLVVKEQLRCRVKVAIIDEAQDLSTAQWETARTLFKQVPTIYLAGDDDQAIHAWAGADVEKLLSIDAERLVLPVSHRLPAEVFNLAQHLAGRIHHRFKKDWRPADHPGSVNHVASIDHLDLRNGETWMLLARNRCFTNDFEAACLEQGVPYATVKGPSVNPEHVRAIVVWERLRAGKAVPAEDLVELAPYLRGWRFSLTEGEFTLAQLREQHGLKVEGVWHEALDKLTSRQRVYYANCLRNGYRLQDKPPVHIGTIHSVKGGEADNVVLKTDLTYRTYQGLEQDPDNEHRVFYVGATRAKKNLYIVDQQEQQGYLI